MPYKIIIGDKESTWPDKPKTNIDISGVCSETGADSVPDTDPYFDIRYQYYENGNYTIDTTYAEAMEAYNAGKILRHRSYAYNEILPLTTINGSVPADGSYTGLTICFAGICINTLGNPVYRRVELREDDTFRVVDYTLTYSEREIYGSAVSTETTE